MLPGQIRYVGASIPLSSGITMAWWGRTEVISTIAPNLLLFAIQILFGLGKRPIHISIVGKYVKAREELFLNDLEIPALWRHIDMASVDSVRSSQQENIPKFHWKTTLVLLDDTRNTFRSNPPSFFNLRIFHLKKCITLLNTRLKGEAAKPNNQTISTCLIIYTVKSDYCYFFEITTFGTSTLKQLVNLVSLLNPLGPKNKYP